jgi:hypothetical protein
MMVRILILVASVALMAICGVQGADAQGVFTLSSFGFKDDLEPTALRPGLTREDLIKALDGHVEGGTSLIGTFSK